MERARELARDLGGLVLVVVLLGLVYLLPPDTSLREMQATGTLRACVPPAYPPLVTGDPEKPGIDIEILEAVAGRLRVAFAASTNEAMGRDFNPRDWNVTRGKCQVLAGGVVASDLTRSFLDTGPAYARTGWAVISPQPLADVGGRSLGVLTIVSGLDRIGLASYLRHAGARAVVVPSGEDLVAGIAGGRFEAGITEALLAGQLASANGWSVAFLPESLPRYDLVFGLWKGDLTLKRAIRSAFADLERDGTLAEIFKRYGVDPAKVAPASG